MKFSIYLNRRVFVMFQKVVFFFFCLFFLFYLFFFFFVVVVVCLALYIEEVILQTFVILIDYKTICCNCLCKNSFIPVIAF